MDILQIFPYFALVYAAVTGTIIYLQRDKIKGYQSEIDIRNQKIIRLQAILSKEKIILTNDHLATISSLLDACFATKDVVLPHHIIMDQGQMVYGQRTYTVSDKADCIEFKYHNGEGKISFDLIELLNKKL